MPWKRPLQVPLRLYAHQCCLVTKPARESCGDSSTILVRLGHILESARADACFLECLDKEIIARHNYRRVVRLPADTGAIKITNGQTLSGSLAAMDITDAECKFCIAHANCTWDGYNYAHYCLGKGICEVGCGNEEESLANAKHTGRIMLGRIMGVPLLYRWKAMDMALAYAKRGRKFLDLLLGVLRRMWSPKNLSDAVRSGEQALRRR